MCRKQGQLLEHEGGIEMDFRIGAKSPVYGARQTAKAANRPLKPSFEKMIQDIENKKINCYNEINDNSIANIERVS